MDGEQRAPDEDKAGIATRATEVQVPPPPRPPSRRCSLASYHLVLPTRHTLLVADPHRHAMASPSKSPDYSLHHISPEGSSIRIDPPLDVPLAPGQYIRVLNSKLLDPRVFDTGGAAGPHTVEYVFNRLIAEAEATGVATNCLFHMQKEFDGRLKAFVQETEREYREVRSTIEGLFKLVHNCRREAATYEYARSFLRGWSPQVADECYVGSGCGPSARSSCMSTSTARSGAPRILEQQNSRCTPSSPSCTSRTSARPNGDSGYGSSDDLGAQTV